MMANNQKKPSIKEGDLYHKLSIIKDLGILKKEGTKDFSRYIQCKCQCGNIISIRWNSLQQNKTKSCGCDTKERMRKYSLETNITHGLSKHPIYSYYTAMINRCKNKNGQNYKDYGGRGITVCKEWDNNFHQFYDWAINNNWKKGLSLDRIDNNKGYSKENCRWITIQEQQNNRRTTHRIKAWNETKTILEWLKDKRCLINKKNTIISRIFIQKWSAEKALSTPLINKGWKENSITKTNKLKNCWNGMKARCYNQKNISYQRYGAKGILVNQLWINSFESFKEWANLNGYKEGLSLERIDYNGNYEPSNCKWIERKLQNNNTKNNIIISMFGETKTVKDWSRDSRCKVSYASFRYRLNKLNMDPETAFLLSKDKNNIIYGNGWWKYKDEIDTNIS